MNNVITIYSLALLMSLLCMIMLFGNFFFGAITFFTIVLTLAGV